MEKALRREIISVSFFSVTFNLLWSPIAKAVPPQPKVAAMGSNGPFSFAPPFVGYTLRHERNLNGRFPWAVRCS
jgi:hypothetical protein